MSPVLREGIEENMQFKIVREEEASRKRSKKQLWEGTLN